MNRMILAVLFLLTATLYSPGILEGGYIFKDGKFMDVDDMAVLPLEDHYNFGITALQAKNWDEAIHQFRIVTFNFPDTALGKEGFYFLGVAYYQSGDIDYANKTFSQYLKRESHPKYFEETFQYKLACADAFKQGARKHIFGSRKLPQIISGEDTCLEIYDEVAASLPNHDLAAKALMAKADLLSSREEYRSSIDTYQMIIRKFAHTEFAAKSYFEIAQVLLKQSKNELQNPDLIAIAQINIKKFTQDFPRDQKITDTEKCLTEMKELFAEALYETGCFYERKNEPKASILYYQNVLAQFPETRAADLSQQRMKALDKYADEMQLIEKTS